MFVIQHIFFIYQVTGGIPPESPTKQWELTFSQPASDYMNYKFRLDRDNVAVENVILEESKGLVKGTLKVSITLNFFNMHPLLKLN